MFLVERLRVNEEQALLPRAAVPCYILQDLSYFSFYSCRLKKPFRFICSFPQVNAVHIQVSWVQTTIKVTIRKRCSECYSKQSPKYPGIGQSWALLIRCPTPKLWRKQKYNQERG